MQFIIHVSINSKRNFLPKILAALAIICKLTSGLSGVNKQFKEEILVLYHLESRGLSTQDLYKFLGNQETVTNILGRKQALTLEMIRKLHQHFGLSADILIQPYALF